MWWRGYVCVREKEERLPGPSLYNQRLRCSGLSEYMPAIMASFERPNLMLRRGQASRSPISPKKQTWANLLVLSSLSVYAIFLALTVCQFKCWNFCTSVLGRSSRLSLSAAAGVSFVYKKALHGSPSLKLYIPGLDTDFDHSFEDNAQLHSFPRLGTCSPR